MSNQGDLAFLAPKLSFMILCRNYSLLMVGTYAAIQFSSCIPWDVFLVANIVQCAKYIIFLVDATLLKHL